MPMIYHVPHGLSPNIGKEIPIVLQAQEMCRTVKLQQIYWTYHMASSCTFPLMQGIPTRHGKVAVCYMMCYYSFAYNN